MRFVVDGATRATQLQSGEAQIAKSLPVANLATLEDDSNLEVHQLGLRRTTVMMLNTSRPPFDEPLVRQAIQKAVDTQAIVDGVYEGAGTAAVGPFGPDTDWAPEGAEAVTADVDEARDLLDQAGVDPESLTFELQAYVERPELADVAAEMKVSCLEVFGPLCTVSPYDSLDEALALANGTEYGLQAGVFTGAPAQTMPQAPPPGPGF